MTSLPSLSLKTNSKIEMELEHISHEHPLILEEEHKGDGVEVSCYGCQQPISGPSYNCKQLFAKDLVRASLTLVPLASLKLTYCVP
ncbi:hypothetical protein LOK49_LG06G02839 [Camellia lanceoleosa]|uniref:Uncharacterized protein n=1 Tax=Camellia lanceoleosa TaxID=1840588 RepID=A0ACC0HAK9_9ERIC|nr:hypothetical protein LOK49_LG06G02839 [Camellia lanceoleosa]